MKENDFSFSSFEQQGTHQPQTAGACHGTCPLAQIPAPVWQDIFRRSWRKRHPVLFWSICIGLALLALGVFLGADEADSPLAGERLALVSVRGSIMDVQPLLDWISKVERNEDVRGVLLRIDSPGGGAAASQELYSALARLASKKPVVTSMGSVAASGGLMVAMAGQKIFANASTVTGSIGVRMDIPQLQGLMGKLGLGQETLVTAPYKDAGSYMRPLSVEDRAYFEHILKDMHEQFVDIVAAGRNLPREKAVELANGKIFTGREALELGLIDALGGQNAALTWLAEQSGVPADRPLLKRPSKKNWLEKSLEASFAALFTALSGMEGAADASGPFFLYQF
ncbi:MAG: signal peptide peptidase SppA [Desulfovibrio sp.]|nr:signal peptide peptidase SppA [Desulfovibrio sp.]